MSAAIYARFSSDLQSERSIEDQVAACQDFARRAGLDGPFRVYADAALSGASMATRPQLQALLADMRGRRLKILIAESIDRLSRDQADVHLIRRAATTNGVRFLTIADGEVTSMVAGLKGIIAEHYLIDLAAKTRRGLMGVARSGRSAGGRCYGYRAVEGEARGVRAIDDAEAAIVLRIYEAYAAGQGPRAIAAALNREGLTAPAGGLWRASTLLGDARAADGLLRQELYRGRLVFNKRRFIKDPETGRRRSALNPESDWIVTPAPDLRIVPEPLWLAVQAKRRALAEIGALSQRRRPKRLLSGLLRCGACGSPMNIVTRAYFGCSAARETGMCGQRRYLRGDVLDRRVLEGLKRNLLSPDLVAEAVRAFHEEARTRQADTDRRRLELGKDLAEARRRGERIAESLIAAPSAILRAKLAETEAQIAALEADMGPDRSATIALHPAAGDLYRARIADLEAALARPDASADTLAAVRALIERVEAKPDASAPDGWSLVIHGHLAAIMALASEMPPGVSTGGLLMTEQLGAGAGFEPTTFRL